MKGLFSLFVTPKAVDAKSSPFHLKTRLDWGEPALTILDVRSREAFNQSRIKGAVSIPLEQLKEQPLGLEHHRDIYVYGDSHEEAAEAQKQLTEAGYVNVSELNGGLIAWRIANGATEGTAED